MSMRFLAIATALAFSAGAVSMAQACPSMKTATTDHQQVVAADKATKAPSTPIVIPQKQKSEG
jgi:ethanolamine utilization microcompartment shell protein EutL